MTRSTALLVCLVWMACFLGFVQHDAWAEDAVVICNKSVSDATLNENDIRDIFLGKKTRWGDGSKTVFVIQKDNETHTSFLKKYIGRTPTQFLNYWKQMMFTGKGKMPVVFKNDTEMIKFISETEGATGYVASTSVTDSVKILAK